MVSFFKDKNCVVVTEDSYKQSTWASFPEVFFKNSLLIASLKKLEPAWRVGEVQDLLRTRTKRHNSYYYRRKLLSAKQTFIEKFDKNKLPLAPPSAWFSFLKQYPFHTHVEKRPSGRQE